MKLSSDPPADAGDGAMLPFPYNGPADLQGPVLAALRRVVDPELALTIVDLGLVYAVEIADDKAYIRMTMTSAACPVADVIMDDVEFELDGVLPTGCTIDIDLCWEPAWAPEMMSARARRFMG